MIDATRTTSALIAALHDAANHEAWREIDERYRPILINVARRAGLSDTDAADVAQDALADLFKSFQDKRYDRSRGRLRQWLLGIARLKIADARRGKARAAGPLDTSIPEHADNDAWTTAWESEQRTAILAQALDELRKSDKLQPHTLQAFELVALRHVPVTDAAAQLGLTAQEVYLAKSRCMERVRSLIQKLQSAYDDD